jgi:hypothetical protein
MRTSEDRQASVVRGTVQSPTFFGSRRRLRASGVSSARLLPASMPKAFLQRSAMALYTPLPTSIARPVAGFTVGFSAHSRHFCSVNRLILARLRFASRLLKEYRIGSR